MIAFISQLVVKLAAIRWLFKLGSLGLLLPVAFLLKAIGIPLLIVLSILALPVLIVLFLFGLPIFAVLALGGVVIGMLGFVMTALVFAAKIALFVVLPVWVVFKLGKAIASRMSRRSNGDSPTDPTSDAPPPSPVDAMPTTE